MKKVFALFLAFVTSIGMIFAVNQAEMASNHFWNISNSEFCYLGTITQRTTVDGLTIYATTTKTVVIDENSKEIDNILFTSRLKLGGTGSSDARLLSFRVDGECYIDIYATSASSTEDRVLNIDKNSFGNTIATVDAWAGTATKSTYHYTGSSTTIYIYSAASGVNIYGIQVRSGEPSEPENARFWNMSKSPFSSLGVISSNRTLNGLSLIATVEKPMEVAVHDEGFEKEIDGYVFTHRLKLNGTGTNEARVISFDVSGFCNIDIYLLSSSSSENRFLNVDCGTFGNTIKQVTAYGEYISKQTVQYRGGAKKIYIYSADNGINIYAIRATALPTPSYQVMFLDYDGKVLSEQTVVHGESAVEPNRPSRAGYNFIGWGTDYTNITAKSYVIAQYAVQNSGNCVVTYKNGIDNSNISSESIQLNVPVAPTYSGYTFLGWQTVSSDLSNGIVISAVYESETHSINNVSSEDSQTRKIVRDGQVYILRGDKLFTMQGQEVK